MSTVQTQQITGVWHADPKHSTLTFAVKHSGVATFRGSLGEFTATLDASGEQPTLRGTGVTTTLTTGDADRDAHLGNADFFDAELYPELRFVSTSFDADGEDVVVKGDLTLRGTTRPVELRGTLEGPVVDAFGTTRFGLELSGKIDRTEYGISWNAPLPGGDFLLANTVRVVASFSLVQES
jgi:polyisoprenoid-binding protein YceI